MNYPRIMIAAANSGSGKTTITCGLLASLKNRGMTPCSFKCGPDYIDPMYHRNALGIHAGNLDTFFTDDATTRWIFGEEYSGDISVIEGVMGLYDGVGGVEEIGSSYDLARALNCPIVLVINGKGAGKSLLATIKGFLDYDKYSLIKGVILNKTSERFGAILKPLIESELGIKYLGTLPDISDIGFESRHLGLFLPNEINDLKAQLWTLGEKVEEQIDLDEIISIASHALDLKKESMPENLHTLISNNKGNKVKLAVAYDEAFCFYYRENLKLLEKLGIEIAYFSPLKDDSLPKDISGILLGGGYPENHLEKLSGNVNMKNEIANAIKSRMPVMAECGGFMYLLEELENIDKKSYRMASALKGKAFYTGHLVRFGYAIIKKDNDEIKGHEFHYFDTDNNGCDYKAIKPSGSRSWECIHAINGGLVGFPHLYYLSNPGFINKFVEAMKNYGGR